VGFVFSKGQRANP